MVYYDRQYHGVCMSAWPSGYVISVDFPIGHVDMLSSWCICLAYGLRSDAGTTASGYDPYGFISPCWYGPPGVRAGCTPGADAVSKHKKAASG